MARKPSGARADTRSAPPPSTRRFTSIADAAEYADVSDRTIRRYIADGRLTGYRMGPRLVKVDLAELDTLPRPIPTGGPNAA